MSVMRDIDIAWSLREWVEDGDKWTQLINPASLDLTISDEVQLEYADGELRLQRLPAIFPPSAFMFIVTEQIIKLPPYIAGEIRLKSGFMRQGWQFGVAGWVDPGYHGALTFSLKSMWNYKSSRLEPGQRFAQIIFHKLDKPVVKPYQGKYQGSKGVVV